MKYHRFSMLFIFLTGLAWVGGSPADWTAVFDPGKLPPTGWFSGLTKTETLPATADGEKGEFLWGCRSAAGSYIYVTAKAILPAEASSLGQNGFFGSAESYAQFKPESFYQKLIDLTDSKGGHIRALSVTVTADGSGYDFTSNRGKLTMAKTVYVAVVAADDRPKSVWFVLANFRGLKDNTADLAAFEAMCQAPLAMEDRRFAAIDDFLPSGQAETVAKPEKAMTPPSVESAKTVSQPATPPSSPQPADPAVATLPPSPVESAKPVSQPTTPPSPPQPAAPAVVTPPPSPGTAVTMAQSPAPSISPAPAKPIQKAAEETNLSPKPSVESKPLSQSAKSSAEPLTSAKSINVAKPTIKDEPTGKEQLPKELPGPSIPETAVVADALLAAARGMEDQRKLDPLIASYSGTVVGAVAAELQKSTATYLSEIQQAEIWRKLFTSARDDAERQRLVVVFLVSAIRVHNVVIIQEILRSAQERRITLDCLDTPHLEYLLGALRPGGGFSTPYAAETMAFFHFQTLPVHGAVFQWLKRNLATPPRLSVVAVCEVNGIWKLQRKNMLIPANGLVASEGWLKYLQPVKPRQTKLGFYLTDFDNLLSLLVVGMEFPTTTR